MTDPFESVVGLLDEEIAAHRRLVELARAEQRALVRGDVAELLQLVSEQEALVTQIRSMERARTELLQLVSEREGLGDDRLTFVDLVQVSRPEVAERYVQQRETLRAVLRELADVQKANALLIQAHLSYVQTVVTLMTRAAGGTTSLVLDQLA